MNQVLAVVDDLMFTSKIRAAARHAGVEVKFSRSRTAALADVRAAAPGLVILDLNNPRTEPLGIIADMKGDATLATIPTLGFSHHTDGETIRAAREAGVGTVMARGAFFEKLPELLAQAVSGV